MGDNRHDRIVDLRMESLKDIVKEANALDPQGPQIKWINKEIGYGLFANSAMSQGQLVCTYGGVQSNDGTGSYCLQRGTTKICRDTEFVFWLSDKGRFVNEAR